MLCIYWYLKLINFAYLFILYISYFHVFNYLCVFLHFLWYVIGYTLYGVTFCQNVYGHVTTQNFHHKFSPSNMLVTITKHNKTIIKINKFMSKIKRHQITELSLLHGTIWCFQQFVFLYYFQRYRRKKGSTY